MPHRSYGHLNFIIDTFTGVPSMALFYASMFFNECGLPRGDRLPTPRSILNATVPIYVPI